MEYNTTIVTRLSVGNAVSIAHILDLLPAVPTCDCWYELNGKHGMVCIAFRGDYSDDELRKLVHHIINHGYQSHDLKLVKFYRTNQQTLKIVSTLKGY